MIAPRTLENTLVTRVVAVLAAGLVVVAGTLVITLALHLRSQAQDSLDTAVRLVHQADRADTTLNEARLSRIVPADGLVAFATTSGVQAIAPDAIEVSALPIDADMASPTRFTVADRRHLGQVVETAHLTLRTSADSDPQEITRVLVALDVSADVATVRRVAGIAAASATLGCVALALIARTVVRRSLRPVHDAATAAARIAQGDASVTMPTGDPYAETVALAGSVADAIRRRTDAERAVRDFVADASHELRTPIAKIQGWSEVALASEVVDEAARRALERAVEATEELAGVVDQLALLARLDARPVATFSPVDIAALAREVIADARVVTPGTRLEITTPHAAVVLGDRVALTRALRNLVGNAIQHGAPPVRLTMTWDAAEIVVTVADHGPGVPADLRGRVFDRFATSAPGNPRHSGLGLAIVDAVARAHAGSVALLDSSSGATFQMRLPTAPTDIVSEP